MAARLAEFLSTAAARGFAWGQHDCMLFAADWARELTGRDPAMAFRGGYETEDEAREIVQEFGGAEALIRSALGVGWREVCGDRRAGDIVLADPPGHGEPIAGIAADARRSALLTRRGLVVSSVPVLRAWRHG
jgi:hypothetical protein